MSLFEKKIKISNDDFGGFYGLIKNKDVTIKEILN